MNPDAELIDHSERTLIAIASDLARYEAWCQWKGVTPVPASEDQVVAWLDDAITEGLKTSTIKRLIFSIGQAHEAKGFISPTKLRSWKPRWYRLMTKLDLRGQSQPSRADELNAENVASILATLGDSRRDLRDATLLAVALDTLFKPAQLVSICREHIVESGDGGGQLRLPTRLTAPRSNRDSRSLSPDAMCRIRHFCDVMGIQHGPLFRPIGGRPKQGLDASSLALRPKELARIIRRRARAAGLTGYFTAYSTRVGGALDLARAGATVNEIQIAGGWRTPHVIAKSTLDIEGTTAALWSLKTERED